MLRNQKGITLIALVITIIVLLILAGVSIAMLTGDNGILSKAQTAGEKSTIGEVDEAIKLGVSDILVDNMDPTTTDKEFNITNLETAIKANNANIADGNIQLIFKDGNLTKEKLGINGEEDGATEVNVIQVTYTTDKKDQNAEKAYWEVVKETGRVIKLEKTENKLANDYDA